jgi:hypothetical protein
MRPPVPQPDRGLLLEVGTFRLREPFSDQEAPMDANSGAPWSEADISDLKN